LDVADLSGGNFLFFNQILCAVNFIKGRIRFYFMCSELGFARRVDKRTDNKND
jgi:hypothetical protein